MRGQRAFIAAAGLVFAALAVIHMARIVFEGSGPLHDPFFVGATLIALAGALWAALLLLRASRKS
jgi:hypothetical protein